MSLVHYSVPESKDVLKIKIKKDRDVQKYTEINLKVLPVIKTEQSEQEIVMVLG